MRRGKMRVERHGSAGTFRAMGRAAPTPVSEGMTGVRECPRDVP
jgi:hypothetical protein